MKTLNDIELILQAVYRREKTWTQGRNEIEKIFKRHNALGVKLVLFFATTSLILATILIAKSF